MIEYYPRRSRLIFQVDLFPARGPVPGNLVEVAEREKDVRFSSERAVTDFMRREHDLRRNIRELWEKLPADLRELPSAKFLNEFGCITTMDIAQLIYRPEEPQGATKDFDFGRCAMEMRWSAGFADALSTLKASPWLEQMPPHHGARTFDVQRRI